MDTIVKMLIDVYDKDEKFFEEIVKDTMNILDEKNQRYFIKNILGEVIKHNIRKSLEGVFVKEDKGEYFLEYRNSSEENIHKEEEETKEVESYNFKEKEYVVNSNVKECLDIQDKSQIWLAKETRISASTLSNLIRNPSSSSLLNAFKVSKTLGLSMEEIFYLSEDLK